MGSQQWSFGNQAFVGSILLLHCNKLYHEAAPHLPVRYIEAINGIEIGPAMGSCGEAAYCGHPIYVSDIGADQLWSGWTEIGDLAAQAGLRACWPVPIMCGDKVLGTFAVYHREARSPTRRGAQLDSRRSAICRRYTCSGSRNIMHEVGMQPQEEGESAQRHTLRPPTPQRST